MTRLPESFSISNGCGNCIHAFRREEQESDPELYCTFDAPPRPNCGSFAMNEQHIADIDETNWAEWAEGRWVPELGVCDQYEL